MRSAAMRLRIGYIPLVDAAALIIAVDKGFAAAAGLDIDLVREVSWSNVRDKLNIGLYSALHKFLPACARKCGPDGQSAAPARRQVARVSCRAL